MNRPLLCVALVALFSAAPALAKPDRMVRVCNEAGACKRVPQAGVRNALVAVTGRLPPAAETTASTASNRRQLTALLAKLH